jgi:hypothetical protein
LVRQAAYLLEPPRPSTLPFIREVGDLGVPLRCPDAQGDDLIIMFELQRPEGYTVTVLAGLPCSLDPVADDEPLLLFRAPILKRVILEIEASASQSGPRPLLEVLLSRREPLLFMRGAGGRIETRSFSEGARTLPTFGDVRSLQWAAADLEKKPGSFAMVGFPSHNVFAMAASDNLGVAVCTYRERKVPVYGILPAPIVRSVAEALRAS